MVLECHRCTGDESYILKVRVASVADLQKLIDRLPPFGLISTSLILSSPVERSTPDMARLGKIQRPVLS